MQHTRQTSELLPSSETEQTNNPRGSFGNEPTVKIPDRRITGSQKQRIRSQHSLVSQFSWCVSVQQTVDILHLLYLSGIYYDTKILNYRLTRRTFSWSTAKYSRLISNARREIVVFLVAFSKPIITRLIAKFCVSRGITIHKGSPVPIKLRQQLRTPENLSLRNDKKIGSTTFAFAGQRNSPHLKSYKSCNSKSEI